MQNQQHRVRTFIAALLIATMLPAAAQAEIVGITPGTYVYNHTDSGSPPITGPDSIQLTTGNDQRRSIWFKTPQDISAGFEATFTYRATSISASALRQGLTFAIQNAPEGTAALGTTYGYGGIAKSLAVTIETDTGPARTYTGVYTNGVLGGGSGITNPVNAFSFKDIAVKIDYNASLGTLSIYMSEGANSFKSEGILVGDLTSVLGGPKGYVGFTASTFNTLGAGGGAIQIVSNFRFVPEPNSLMLAAVGVVAIGGLAFRRQRRT